MINVPARRKALGPKKGGVDAKSEVRGSNEDEIKQIRLG